MIVVLQAILYLIHLMQLLLVIRAILSWVPLFTGAYPGALNQVLATLTEPILSPVRNLLNRHSYFAQTLPIDLSFIIAYVILQVIASIIRGIILTAL